MLLYAAEHSLEPWGILLTAIWALPLTISYIKTKKRIRTDDGAFYREHSRQRRNRYNDDNCNVRLILAENT